MPNNPPTGEVAIQLRYVILNLALIGDAYPHTHIDWAELASATC